jgi:hypothetical protein
MLQVQLHKSFLVNLSLVEKLNIHALGTLENCQMLRKAVMTLMIYLLSIFIKIDRIVGSSPQQFQELIL